MLRRIKTGGHRFDGSYESQQLSVFNFLGENSSQYVHIYDFRASQLKCGWWTQFTCRFCCDNEQKADLVKLTWLGSTTTTT